MAIAAGILLVVANILFLLIMGYGAAILVTSAVEVAYKRVIRRLWELGVIGVVKVVEDDNYGTWVAIETSNGIIEQPIEAVDIRDEMALYEHGRLFVATVAPNKDVVWRALHKRLKLKR